ncbi:hypothetical protein APUTEX25_002762, partial [Auxenochlorella protothecoides]
AHHTEIGAKKDALEVLKHVPNQLLINGKFVDAKSGKTFAVYDPRTEEEIFRIAEADAADVDDAVAAAREAFDHGPWPRMSGRARGRIIYKLADLIERDLDMLATVESLDNGKPLSVAKAADITLTIDHLRYFAGWADKLEGKTIPTDGNHFAYTLVEPKGVVGQIVPWNFPALMMAWKIAPALACGNAIVLKPAEQTPMSALIIGKLALEAGLPPGVLNILPGFGPTAGARLTSHPAVDKVAFTGSTEVGRIIMKSCAEHIKDVTLELGGKSAMIIGPTKDIDNAVDIAHFALFFNQGQVCTAASRLFVHESVYDEFCAKAAEYARKRKVGDPFEAETEQGPQIDNEQFEKILGYIESGKEQGARLLTGGARVGKKGFYIQPTVFADVKDEMKIAREEIFGPVQSILKWSTTEEVLRRANASEYGLAAGIVCDDIHLVNTLSRGLRAGTIWVNTYHVYDHGVPFGGYKMSGVGRDKGSAALAHYTNTKAVVHKLEGEQAW